MKLAFELIETTRLGPSVVNIQGEAATTPLGPEVAVLPVSPANPKAGPPIWPNSVSALPVKAPVVSITSRAALDRSAKKYSPVLGSKKLMSKEFSCLLGFPAVPLIGIILIRRRAGLFAASAGAALRSKETAANITANAVVGNLLKSEAYDRLIFTFISSP